MGRESRGLLTSDRQLSTKVKSPPHGSGEIAHFCNGCCQSEEHSRELVTALITRIFVGKGPRVFPRHKWVGAEEAIDWFGRLACCHGMLSAIVRRLLSKEQAVASAAADLELLPILQGSQGPFQATDESDFKVIFGRWKAVMAEWCTSYPSLLSDLVSCKQALRPQVRLMSRQLFLSSASWDQQQASNKCQTGERTYRPLVAYKNEFLSDCLEEVKRLLHTDFSEMASLDMRTVRRKNLFFRLLARVGASTHHYLLQRHIRYPFKVFGLLQHDKQCVQSLAGEILEDFAVRPCVLDSFSQWFLKEYGHSVDTLCSRLALLELEAIACEVSVDIASTECQHAANRRLITGKGVQTHPVELPEASAHFIARGMRRSTWLSLRAQRREAPRMKKKRGPQPRRQKGTSKFFPKAKGPLQRGGGIWTVFLSERAKRVNMPSIWTPEGKADMTRASQEFRDLPRAELDRLHDLAFTAAQARKHGDGHVVKRAGKVMRAKTKTKALKAPA